ncbi:cold shock domain-containing protein [Nitrobacter sp. NHB1]|uniref:cold-shock protein n=1 Tax=Nitrobacter sp. NHB1 TaxID=3119830 RepID=UPI003000BAD9
MATGVVKFFLDSKGYGFIGPDDGSQDIFLHVHGLADKLRYPSPQDRVEYDVGRGPDGRLRANNVAIIN